MLITRRKLVRASLGLIAAPAIIGRAEAAFAIFQTSRAVITSPSFVDPALAIAAKPTGIPRLNLANPLTQGLIYAAVDTGLGAYVITADCFPGHGIFQPLLYNCCGQPGGGFFANGNLPSTITTRWGTGFNWPGGVNDSVLFTMGGKACTTFIQDNSALRTAQNLSAQAAGVGYTMGAAHVQNAGGLAPVIFGRCIPEFAPSIFILANGQSLSDVTNRQIVAGWYNGTAPGDTITSTVNPPLGSFNVSFLTAINTSAGVSTVDLTVNGKVEATKAGTTVSDTGPSNGSLEQDEGQLNFGGFAHIASTHASNCFGGQMLWGCIWKRQVTLAERASAYYNPWQMWIWP